MATLPAMPQSGAQPIAYPDAQYYGEMGDNAIAAGRPDLALTDYARAMYINPYNSQLRDNLGATLQRFGRDDLAIPQLQAALQLDPGNMGAIINLSSDYTVLLHRPDLSIRLISGGLPYIRQNPENARLLPLLLGNLNSALTVARGASQPVLLQPTLNQPGFSPFDGLRV